MNAKTCSGVRLMSVSYVNAHHAPSSASKDVLDAGLEQPCQLDREREARIASAGFGSR